MNSTTFHWIVGIFLIFLVVRLYFAVVFICIYSILYAMHKFSLVSWKMTNWILVHSFSFHLFSFKRAPLWHTHTHTCNQREWYPVIKRNKRNENMYKKKPQKHNKRTVPSIGCKWPNEINWRWSPIHTHQRFNVVVSLYIIKTYVYMHCILYVLHSQFKVSYQMHGDGKHAIRYFHCTLAAVRVCFCVSIFNQVTGVGVMLCVVFLLCVRSDVMFLHRMWCCIYHVISTLHRARKKMHTFLNVVVVVVGLCV